MNGSLLVALYAIIEPPSKGRSLNFAVCDGSWCAGYAIQLSDFQKGDSKSFARRQILIRGGRDATCGVLFY